MRRLAAMRPMLRGLASHPSCASAVLIRAAARRFCSSAVPFMEQSPPPPGFTQVLLIECGVGTDQHGQSLTKACVRACKDAISFNSVPALESL